MIRTSSGWGGCTRDEVEEECTCILWQRGQIDFASLFTLYMFSLTGSADALMCTRLSFCCASNPQGLVGKKKISDSQLSTLLFVEVL